MIMWHSKRTGRAIVLSPSLCLVDANFLPDPTPDHAWRKVFGLTLAAEAIAVVGTVEEVCLEGLLVSLAVVEDDSPIGHDNPGLTIGWAAAAATGSLHRCLP